MLSPRLVPDQISRVCRWKDKSDGHRDIHDHSSLKRAVDSGAMGRVPTVADAATARSMTVHTSARLPPRSPSAQGTRASGLLAFARAGYTIRRAIRRVGARSSLRFRLRRRHGSSASTNSAATNGRRSSILSPTPMNYERHRAAGLAIAATRRPWPCRRAWSE